MEKEMESPSTVDRGLEESQEEEESSRTTSGSSPGPQSPPYFDALGSFSPSVSNHHRDFLPIKTEIKKMGVEISDERAEQLKNDVRRLSPEVVSLRERTLGEISLTPDSSFFEAEEEDETEKPTPQPSTSESSWSSEKLAEIAMSEVERDHGEHLVATDHRTEPQTLDPEQISAALTPSTIQKLAEDEEIVFTGVNVAHVQLQSSASSSSSSSPTTNPTNAINFMIAYPEASPCSSTESADCQDPLRDQEETDSDSSEPKVLGTESEEDRLRIENTKSGGREVVISCERIEPEQFTEDSAESLALATGNRDEVRSDGSDSGLGGEIGGDHGGNQGGPAPESDSETSFLDRIPDEILSDKDKSASVQLDGFVPIPGDADAMGSCQVQRPVLLSTPILPALRSPPKSNLKRRLTDCMEGEPNPKRSNPDESQKKKRNIHFDAVTVYYFPRAQGFTCVPSQGGSTLGMSSAHTHAERFSLTEHAAEQRRIHRARLAQLRSERAANNVVEAASSSEDPSDDTDEEPSDAEELDIDSYYFLLPVPTWQRRALLRAAGVQKIDTIEKDECRDIRASRKHCGCGCKGYCDPESCPCSRAHVKCQVDRAGFPCGCSRDGCANSSGRIEFNPVRVRTHFIHTLMRLELEKKHRDEDCPDLRDLDHQPQLRDARGLPDPSCSINGSGFTTLHYPTPPEVASCQPEIPGAREDSLDLYAIRDDCYPPSEDAADAAHAQNGPHHHRKLLHPPEFAQSFQGFGNPGGGPSGVQQFQQNSYQDYQAYQTLPSTSRGQFHTQFQQQSFSHYGGYAGDGNMGCHQGQNLYEGSFPQEDGAPSQYTNLSSVQPLMGNNSAVHSHQQIAKLEPFSELLAGRYSYYGEVEQPQNHAAYPAASASKETEKMAPVVDTGNNVTQENGGGAATDECDENFGEIIKKSMVETVSA